MSTPEINVAERGCRAVYVTFFKGQALVSFHIGGGGHAQYPLECEHNHTTPDAAEKCGRALARDAKRNPAKYDIDLSTYVPWPEFGFEVVNGEVVERKVAER